MPKHKKTRQQKMLADNRREMSTPLLYTITPESLPKQAKQPLAPIKQTTTISTTSYNYLGSDLRKTAFFTGAIVLIELIILFFTK